MDNGSYEIIKRAYSIISKERGTLTNSDISLLGGYLETLIEVYADNVEPPKAGPAGTGGKEPAHKRIARTLFGG